MTPRIAYRLVSKGYCYRPNLAEYAHVSHCIQILASSAVLTTIIVSRDLRTMTRITGKPPLSSALANLTL